MQVRFCANLVTSPLACQRGKAAWQGLVLVLTISLASTLPLVADDDPTPSQLLERMALALRNYDYSGDFVYQTGELLNAMHIDRLHDNGLVREKLLTLTGPVREIVREDKRLTRRDGVAGAAEISEHRRASLPTLTAFDPKRIDSLYRLELLGGERVAGRDTRIIAVMPRDTLRYGHRLYLDRKTGIPLRRVVLDHNGAYVSQLMFVAIQIGAMHEDDAAVFPDSYGAFDYHGPWLFNGLPEGFLLELHEQRVHVDQLRDHFFFSDGVTRLSLYIEDDTRNPSMQHSSVGGVGIVSTRVGAHRVTVVGEAPLETLKLFLTSVVRASDD